MANTVIQLKFSNVTATPPSLNVAEPAYSYASNTFFIGSPDGTGSIAIGGKFYLDQQQDIYNLSNASYNHANAAFEQANTGGGGASSDQYARDTANAAFEQANTGGGGASSDQYARDTANASFIHANAAFDFANSTFVYATAAFNHANSGFNAANTADLKAVTSGTYANSAFDHANGAFNHANAGFTTANSAQAQADAAFTRANNSLNANTGGIITGDLEVTGNLVISGNTTFINTEVVNVEDSLIKLANNNIVGDTVDIGFYGLYNSSGVKYAGLARTAGSNNFFLFKDLTDDPASNSLPSGSITAANVATLIANVQAYSVTINGVDVESYIGNAYDAANTADSKAVTAGSYANSAFNHANSSFVHANSSFDHANAAFEQANTDVTNVSITANDFGSASIVPTFHVAANGRIDSISNVTIAIAASQIASGEVSVTRGGTGVASLILNGVVLGQGTSAVTTASSSTEGHVLTINNSGVPTFSHLFGGTF